jgi:hypothetical protein
MLMSQSGYEEGDNDCAPGKPAISFEILAPKLELIRSEIGIGLYRKQLPKANEMGFYWAGADVAIAKVPKYIDGCLVVTTPFAAEVGWFYRRFFDVAYEARLIDYFSKYEFAGKLGECVLEFHAASTPKRKTKKALLLAMQQRVKDVAVKLDLYGDAIDPQ